MISHWFGSCIGQTDATRISTAIFIASSILCTLIYLCYFKSQAKISPCRVRYLVFIFASYKSFGFKCLQDYFQKPKIC